MIRMPHADDFFSQKDAEFFYQREFKHEFKRVYAHAALVLAVRDDYTQLADTREFTMWDSPKASYSLGEINLPPSHPTLSYRVGL